MRASSACIMLPYQPARRLPASLPLPVCCVYPLVWLVARLCTQEKCVGVAGCSAAAPPQTREGIFFRSQSTFASNNYLQLPLSLSLPLPAASSSCLLCGCLGCVHFGSGHIFIHLFLATMSEAFWPRFLPFRPYFVPAQSLCGPAPANMRNVTAASTS